MIVDGLGPCDFASVASHVAVKLDRAAHTALSYDDLADGYVHVIPADVSRVKRFAKLTSDADAIRWMVVTAVGGLRPKVDVLVEDGKVRLSERATIETLTFDGRKVYEVQNRHAKLRDPFNPMSGEFSDNIRRSMGSLDDLRESMREFGWLPQFPAIKDERGVVLVGHRRLAVAAELGIEPVIRVVPCGEGDDGDADRFRLAIASNLAAKPFTPEERKRIAMYLYGDLEWRMTAIGKALAVSQTTISNDLREVTRTNNPPHPERGGRPQAPAKNRKDIPELEAEVRELVESGSVIPRFDIADRHDVSTTVVRRVMEHELARHAERTKPPPHCPTCTCTG